MTLAEQYLQLDELEYHKNGDSVELDGAKTLAQLYQRLGKETEDEPVSSVSEPEPDHLQIIVIHKPAENSPR